MPAGAVLLASRFGWACRADDGGDRNPLDNAIWDLNCRVLICVLPGWNHSLGIALGMHALPQIVVLCGPVYGRDQPCVGVILDRQSSLNETGKHLGKPLGFVPDGIECSLENRELVPWRPGHGGFEHGDVSA